MLTNCSAGTAWVPGGSTGHIKVARKGTGRPTSYADG